MGTFAAQGQPEAVAELIAFNRTNPATPIDQASRIYGRFALAACRTHEIDGQILKQMESTSAFSATNFFLAGNLDSFVSPFG